MTRVPMTLKGVLRRAGPAALGFWLLFYVVNGLYKIVLGGVAEPFAVMARNLPYNAVLLLLAMGFSLLAYAVAPRLAVGPRWRQAVSAFLLVTALCVTFEPIMRLVVGSMGGGRKIEDLTLAEAARAALFWQAPFAIWTVGVFAILHQAEAVARARRLAEAEAAAREAQVRALQYQVNPHFLHNTLNSIASLILNRRLDEAEHMVVQLSRFFRANLDSDPLIDHTLAQEVALQQLYLEIERVRFDDFLAIDTEVTPEAAEALVPPMILQPLVENVLKHGLHGPGRVTTLKIAAARTPEGLAVEVRDDGRGAGEVRDGVGLRNIRDRLAARFPDRSSLSIASEAGFAVRLTMPYERRA